MKRSLKRLPALLLLTGLLFLTGCSSSVYLENEADYQSRSDQYVLSLANSDTAVLQAELENLEAHYEDFEQQVALYPYIGSTGQKFEFTAEAYVSMLTSYLDNLEELGAYVGLKEYEGATEDADGNITYSAVYEFEKHDMRFSLAYDSDMVVTTVSLDPIYSTGEIAEKAALNTLIGMGSVFVVLIILCFLISCFKYIHMAEERARKGSAGKKTAESKSTRSQTAAPDPELAAAIAGAVAASEGVGGDDYQLVAVITAAIAAAEGTSADSFTVRSIRRRKGNKWGRR